MSRWKEWARPAFYLGQNPTTLAGAVLTTSSAITMLGFWTFELLRAGPVHPYTGIVFFFILPAIFVLGLILMPLGGLLRRYRLRQQGKLLDLLEARLQQLAGKDLLTRAYVLEEGRIVADGAPDDLLARPEIQRAYLGV